MFEGILPRIIHGLLLYDKTFPGKNEEYTKLRDLMIEQSTNITKIHFGEIMNFIRVIYRNMSERFL